MVLIIIISLILFVANFSPGTWLTGWDNLHPEFNFWINTKRSLFATWQEYQGLGLLGGMGHASDLPRQTFLWLLSLILPDNWLRQIFFFLMLLSGGLGTFLFTKKIILRKLLEDEKNLAATAGGLFYILNLATVQTFYAPFSSFALHFAALPWLFLSSFLYIRNPSAKHLLLLLGVNLLAIPQVYVPTIFFVFLFALFGSFLVRLIQTRLRNLRRYLFVGLTIFIVNAFWLLPFLYFGLTSAEVTIESKINQMGTETNFLQNKKYGDLEDVITLQGFWFDLTEPSVGGQPKFIMGQWQNHLQNLPVFLILFLAFGIIILGLAYLFQKRNPYRFVILFLSLSSFTILANNVPPFSWIDSFLYRWPLFAQVFRFPYTKFSILLVFSYAVLFGYGILWFKNTLQKYLPPLNLQRRGLQAFLRQLISLPVLVLLAISVLPAFQGQLFYKNLKAPIPQEYSDLQEFFKQQSLNERVANFPQYTFWGWNFYDWGYVGSGFLWYGIEQPILDRAFDVWSRQNENYYWEMSYAVYSGNTELFEKALEKYHVNWIIVDGHITNPMSPKALYFDELAELVVSSPKIKFVQKFGEIKVYKVNLEAPVNNYVFLAQNLPVVAPTYKWNNYDRAFIENSHYISQIENKNIVNSKSSFYPFRSVFTGKEQHELEFEIEEKEDIFIFRKHFNVPENHYISVPSIDPKKYVWIDPNNLSHQKFVSPDIVLNSKFIEVYIPKINGYLSSWINPAEAVPQAEECRESGRGKVENQIVENGGEKLLRLSSIDTNNCSATFWLPNVPHNLGYIMTIEGRNIQGKKLVFWLENQNSRKPDIEIHLLNGKLSASYIVQPPMEDDGVGYTLHFDNLSIGNEKTVNDLGEITINPLPYEFLTNLSLRPINQESEPVVYHEVEAEHSNPSLYTIRIENLESGIQDPVLVLSQAFDKGWIAYIPNSKFPILNSKLLLPIFGKKLNNRVSVNNWANGWILDRENDTDKEIVIIFWPQYLQYLGFFLLFAFGVLILVGPRLPRFRHSERPMIYYREKHGPGSKEEKTKQADDSGN